jgi:hypothetical protein
MKEDLIVALVLVLIPVSVFLGLRRFNLVRRIAGALSVLLLVAIAVPNFVKSRGHMSQNACVNNLKCIQEAKRRWAEINHKSPTDVPTMADIFNEKNDLEFSKGTDYPPGAFKTPLTCPAGGTYILGAVNEEVKCSIGPPQHTLHPE